MKTPPPLTITTSPKPGNSPRHSPLLPSATPYMSEKSFAIQQDGPKILGIPLKYLSLFILAVQNASLSIVMHYSRISTPPSLSYSPASAVLLNEILKGSISFIIASLARIRDSSHRKSLLSEIFSLCSDIFSPDCWKLSIPALLYVIQNSLQFVAISNLPVASFQVAYQMKILTTAAFSVALLRKKLTPTKWLSLFFLAIGVGIVQIQTTTSAHPTRNTTVGSAHEFHNIHIMSPMKGFSAVIAACFTSGLAGVYFEMVLKGSKADLWIRNVQLSLFSLIPALLPILYETKSVSSRGFLPDLFRNFGTWAWATVAIQVLGGLMTAIVIKYSDNILKGFATSLSIVLAFLASVVLFNYSITPSFVIGASTVLSATWMYNQPASREPLLTIPVHSPLTGKSSAFPPDDEILRNKAGLSPSPRVLNRAMEINVEKAEAGCNEGGVGGECVVAVFGETLDTARYHCAPYGSPYGSHPPSRHPSRPTTPLPPSPLYSEGTKGINS